MKPLQVNVIISIPRISQMSNALKIKSYSVKYFMVSKDKNIKKNPHQRFLKINALL